MRPPCSPLPRWPGRWSLSHAWSAGSAVDDHPEVHAAIHGTVDHQYFCGAQSQPVPDYGIPTPSWADAERLIETSLESYARMT
jgi:hypothetical protein